MKAFVKPTIGSWDLGDLVKEPHGHEFKKFLETIKKNLIEFESNDDIFPIFNFFLCSSITNLPVAHFLSF
jgi:hypothetical protein